MSMTVIQIVNGTLGMVPKGLEREQEKLEIGGRTETIQTTFKQNTGTSPGYLRRVVVTQTQVKDHQLTVV